MKSVMMALKKKLCVDQSVMYHIYPNLFLPHTVLIILIYVYEGFMHSHASFSIKKKSKGTKYNIIQARKPDCWIKIETQYVKASNYKSQTMINQRQKNH